MAQPRAKTSEAPREMPTITTSVWCGSSGGRYAVVVYPLEAAVLTRIGDGVVIAVERDKAGIGKAVLVAVSSSAPGGRLGAAWCAAAEKRGATEIHIHQHAEAADERMAIVRDLGANEKG